MSTENCEDEIFHLDEVFKKNLALIRPHILGIKSITDANLCRAWLEKLSNCSAQEKEIRNSYINSLRLQVEAGILEPPFSSPPPQGPLTSAVVVHKRNEQEVLSSYSCSDVTSTTLRRTYEREANYTNSEEESFLSVLDTNCHCQLQLANADKQNEENNANKALIARYKEALRFLISIPNNEGDTLNKIEQVQHMYESKMESLKKVIKELQEENTRLKQETEQSQFSKQQIDSTACEWNIFRAEIDILKSKLTEVQNNKIMLEDSHRDVLTKYQQEMSVAISHLFHRLTEAQTKNRRVEMQLEDALEKIQKYTQQSEQRNMAALENERIEECLKSNEMNKEIISLKNMLALKNEEVKHLEEALKTHCFNMQKEVKFLKDDLKHTCDKKEKKFQAKVSELQKVLDKHSRVKAKLQKNFKYKLHCVSKEKNLEVKGLELQLHTQRAEIAAAVSKDKQKELEAEVSKLEERYKEMLIELERKYISQRDEDQKKINQLETELSSLTTKMSRSKLEY